jgi:hypothetical protein
MLRHLVFLLSAIWVVLVLTWSPCHAQVVSSTFGAIAGTIADSTGAVVAAAQITVTGNETGVVYKTVTSHTGGYAVSNLPVGTYSVQATAPGFGATTDPLVKVSVAFTSTANLVLKTQTVIETVNVSADTTEVQVNTADANLSTLLSNKDIMDLPLQDRDPTGLVYLSPGAVQSTTYLGGPAVNGSRDRSVNYLVDGADNNYTYTTGTMATPDIDATAEFRVVTGGYDAQYGRNVGGQILVATKGGTNVFHGAAYYYFRSNNVGSASPYFSTTGPAPLDHREYGGQIGGPIVHNRTFFFVNYEGHHDNDGSSTLNYVPDPNFLSGQLPDTGYGPIDLTSAANNIYGVPQSAVMKNIESLYPAPNYHAEDFIPGFIDAWRANTGYLTTLQSVAAKVDHHFSDKHSLAASYGYQKGSYVAPPTFPQWHDNFTEPSVSQIFTLSLVSSFSPNSINNLRLSANRTSVQFEGAGTGEVPGDLVNSVLNAFSSAGAPQGTPFPGETLNERMIQLAGGPFTNITVYPSDYVYSGTYTIADNFTRIRGNHTLVFGGDYNRTYENTANNFYDSEYLSMNYAYTDGLPLVQTTNGVPISPYDYSSTEGAYLNAGASWYYGLAGIQSESQFFNNAKKRMPSDERGERIRSLGLFAQDHWKIRPNLTLTYGLRWQVNGVPWEVHGILNNLTQDPNGVMPAGGWVFQPVGKNSGGSQNLYNNDYRDFGPRFGFAWDPFHKGKTSIRGGYGVFYDRAFGNLYGNNRSNIPYQQSYYNYVSWQSPAPASVDMLARPTTLPTSNVLSQEYTYQGAVLFALPGNNPWEKVFRMPMEQHYSLGIQHEILPEFMLDVGYVGSNGQHEFNWADASQTSVTRVNALTGSSNAISNYWYTNWTNGVLDHAFYFPGINLSTARSEYNSLQVKVTKRLASHTFGNAFIQGSYTWSHSIDNGVDPEAPGLGESGMPMDSSGYVGGLKTTRGNSGFDVRHVATANFTYELPLHFKSGWQDKAFGHFEVSGIVSEHTGNAYSIWDTVDSAGTGVNQFASWANSTNTALGPASLNPAFPITGPSQTLFAHSTPVGDTFDESTGTFVGTSGIGRQGTVGRNYFYGPHWEDFDCSILKRIPIKEKYTFRVEASAFNAFNHPVMAIPNATIDEYEFGQSTSQANGPRNFQFAARLEF